MEMIPLAQIHGVDDLRLAHVVAPECGPDDVVVRVRECGICGSDLSYLAIGGLTGPDTPMPIGHELWGQVQEKGVNVNSVDVGDRVVVQPLGNGSNIGNGGPEGGFSPLLLVREVATFPDAVHKLPKGFPAAYGALVEPMSVAQHSANRVSAGPSDKAVIYGAGPIGLSLLLVLAYRGLKHIAVIDLSDKRLDIARALGASVFRGDDLDLAKRLTDLHGSTSFFGMPMPGSTVFFEATGVRGVFENIVNIAGPGSRICLTGLHKESATVDLVMLLAKEIPIIPAMGYEQEFSEVIDMLASGKVDPTVLITHHYSLTDIQAAFAQAKDPHHAVKVMVDCQS
ncbi:MAG: alcohol dehydrogenase catalytic domain-containing protein [Halioglobus sp.]|nr:alcohol dehydrogenase catalytic domain-containing protein [Halioglobus sp.]